MNDWFVLDYKRMRINITKIYPFDQNEVFF